jgi:hypothetical protein
VSLLKTPKLRTIATFTTSTLAGKGKRIVSVNMIVRVKNLEGLQNLRTRLRLGLLQVRRHA